MKKPNSFVAGAGVMALAVGAIMMLTAAKAPPSKASFDEITVGRINIAEPDGTKRLIISNKAQFPGSFEQGKEIARPDRRDFAGMIFVSDEGTENGGLIQRGSMTADGKINSGVSLTFDRFRQDQALQLINTDSEQHQMTALIINDVPHHRVTSMQDVTKFQTESAKLPDAEREKYWQKLKEDKRLSENRIFLGTTGSKGSALLLNDAKGRTRMMLLVSENGEPEIQMLDESGKMVKRITPGG
jgi:hypothetical protein